MSSHEVEPPAFSRGSAAFKPRDEGGFIFAGFSCRLSGGSTGPLSGETDLTQASAEAQNLSVATIPER